MTISIDKNEYKVSLSGHGTADVGIGGTTEKFVPNINISSWNDECWLNINPKWLVISDQIESFVDDKISIAVGDIEWKVLQSKDESIEMFIIFKSKPATNIFPLDVDFPEGLQWRYQGSLYEDWLANSVGLTWEEYQEACYRPDRVVGSYALYWNKKHNKYKTGKFGHMYAWEAIDNRGEKSKIPLEYSPVKKQLILNVDQKFLNTAKYPVTLTGMK